MTGSRPVRLTAHSGGFGLQGRPLFSLAAAALVLPLSALHGWLLWLRISQGRLLEWGVAFRWGVGALLLLTLLALRRRGVPLFWGRKALALWTLVLLIHQTAPASAPGARMEGPVPPPLLFVLPASAGPLALAAGLLWARWAERRARLFTPQGSPFTLLEAGVGPLAPRFLVPLFARPPPA
ncbi:MAG TPA: hypothetical protein VN461_07940 [Vicinamibacteria bacterium]|jgi:hypothetical protein|nr:hypothetical protein [Vicinamibacteria bacterium]